MDVFTKRKRSEIMSHIRGTNTKLEQNFCKLISGVFYPQGFRYRRNYKKLPGKPDIAFVSKKIAIFLDGDFWHGKNFQKTGKRLPKLYWQEKISNNIKRDKQINKILKKDGWEVLRFWESEIKRDSMKAVKKIHGFLLP